MAPGAHAAGGSEPRRHRRLGAGRVEAAAHRRDPARARLWPPQGCIFLEIGEPRHRLKGREGGPGERPKGTREPGWQFSMATRRRRMSNFTRDVSARARRKRLVDAGVGAGVQHRNLGCRSFVSRVCPGFGAGVRCWSPAPVWVPESVPAWARKKVRGLRRHMNSVTILLPSQGVTDPSSGNVTNTSATPSKISTKLSANSAKFASVESRETTCVPLIM